MAATGSEIANAFVTLTVKMPGVKDTITKSLGGAAKSAETSGQAVGQRFNAGMDKIMKRGAQVAGAGVAAVLGTAIVKGFGRLKAIETAQAKMRGLGYTGKEVTGAMDAALASVKGTAFGLGDAATVASQMMAAGIKPGQELERVLTTVANNAAAAGIGMDEMGGIFSKAATQVNGVQNDVISQLADRGLPIYQALADQMGVTAGEVFKMASSGEVSFADFAAAAEAAAGTVAEEMGNTTTGAFDNMIAALGRLGAKLLEDIYPLIGPLFKDITKWLDEATVQVEPLVDAFGDWLGKSAEWLKENIDLIRNTAIVIGSMVAAYYTIRGVIAVINGVRAAIAVARAVQLGWTAATYGAAGASYAAQGATMAQTVAMKAGMVAQKLWNAVVVVGRGLWALLNGSLIKSAALWVANTAKIIANRVAQIANNAGLSLWLKLAGMQIAAAARSTATWVANTSAMVAQRVATLASTAATKAATIAQKAMNIAMKANPIGIVITAVMALVGALIWFFTQTDTGRAIWENLMTFLSEAWTNIVALGKELWEGLGQFFSGLWENIKGFFSAAVDWIVDMFMNWTVYGLIIQNWDAIVQFFVDTWDNITGLVSKAIGYVKLVITAGIMVIKNTWNNIWNGIKTFFAGIWNWLVSEIRKRIDYFKSIFRAGVTVLRDTWKNIWESIRTTFSNVWQRIKDTFVTMIDYVKTKPVEAFRAARDAIGKAWEGIQNLAKKPVKFVVETVINGLIGTINKIPGVNLKKLSLPKGFADGGWTGPGSKFTPAGLVHADEFVVSKAARRRFEANHPGALDHINKTGALPGFAKGGLVHPLPGGRLTAGWLGYPGHRALDFAAAAGTPVRAAGAGVVRMAGWNSQGLGNNVDIAHANGLITRYSHMLAPLLVRAGQTVKKAQRIGLVGSTGNSTGPHLHYEVHRGYQNRVNPTPYLGGGGEAGGEGFGILDGLIDWATDKFKKSFPGSDMWVDVAGGLMRDSVGKIVKSVTGLLSHGGPTLYDNGGWLQPGTHLVQNKTGRPEPILTGQQWDALTETRADGPLIGEAHFHAADEGSVGEIGYHLRRFKRGGRYATASV